MKPEITIREKQSKGKRNLIISLLMVLQSLSYNPDVSTEMGKASRWIINFLLGKNDERNRKKKKKKRNSDSFSADNLGTSSENSVHSGTPKLKLRLSFGKQTGRTKRVKKRELEEETDRVDHNYVKALTRTASVRANAAATKIQAVYRAHLARKALQALKGLVKIQALVRGHLVRKQTAATVKSIQALMAIQVRARAQRIQTMKEGQPREGRKSSSKHLSNHNLSKKLHGEKMGMNLEELRESLKSRSEYLNHSQPKKMQHELKTYYSKQKVFVAKNQDQDEKYSINSEPNSPQHYPNDSKPISSYSHQIFPSFMANTESSRAKFRSQSEPKQRPETNNRGKSKRIESVSGMSFLESDRMIYSLKNHDLWFMKVQSSARSSKEKNYDSVSHSNSRKFNASYELPVSLF